MDVTLNNAGISMNKPTLELSGEEWRRAIDIDLSGVFCCCQGGGAHHGRARGRGHCQYRFNVRLGRGARTRRLLRGEGGVVALTKSLAVEWARHGIRVNALCPGYIRTALVEDLIARGALDAGRIEARAPMGRFGTPEEMAEVALFLASDAARYTTGHAMLSDGGWTANGYL